MYEMYPQEWALETAEAVLPPRRRRRKEHPVLPAVIARQVEAAESRRPLR